MWDNNYSTTPLNTHTHQYNTVQTRLLFSLLLELVIVVLISHTSQNVSDLKLKELTTVVVADRAHKITTHRKKTRTKNWKPKQITVYSIIKQDIK
jgi:hypothetical protein